MKILYEDKEILVVYKEAGLPVQTGRTSQKDLVSLLKNHLAKEAKGELTGDPYLGIVHRLDQPVEGLIVFAKTQKSAAKLSRQAAAKADGTENTGRPEAKKGRAENEETAAEKKERTENIEKEGMEKIYQAVVCLNPSSYPLAIEGMKREVVLSDWLGRDTSTNTAYIAQEKEHGAKYASLSFRTIRIWDSKALLEIRLHTGRHHQIRVQMEQASMPLMGDRKYGTSSDSDKREGRSFEEYSGPLCLCAARLSFQHPKTKKRLQFCVTPSWLSLVSKDANMNDET